MVVNHTFQGMVRFSQPYISTLSQSNTSLKKFYLRLMFHKGGEKAISIKYPLKAGVSIRRKSAMITIIILFIVIFCIDCHNLIHKTSQLLIGKESKICLTTEESKLHFLAIKIYSWIDASIYCFIPITLLCILNGIIIHTIIKMERQYSEIVTGQQNVKSKRSEMERQITRMLLMTTSLFALLTTPLACIQVIDADCIMQSPPR